MEIIKTQVLSAKLELLLHVQDPSFNRQLSELEYVRKRQCSPDRGTLPLNNIKTYSTTIATLCSAKSLLVHVIEVPGAITTSFSLYA